MPFAFGPRNSPNHISTTRFNRRRYRRGPRHSPAVLAGQARKVLLVESVERLLEASTRDAFSDLLNLIRNDTSWRLLITCRDYSTDLVRSSFLEAVGISHAVVRIPPLDDEELAAVEKAVPAARRPLASQVLRTLMRNPYVLDMALRMPWPEDKPLPADEREFRTRFWQTIVRADHRAAAGLPQRRERAFVDVALRRARALALFAPCGGLDEEVLHGLRAESLIVSPPHSLTLAAPAHDVLEDWAILRWIQERHDACMGSMSEFAQALGPYPAIRRTYRKWGRRTRRCERDRSGRVVWRRNRQLRVDPHSSRTTPSLRCLGRRPHPTS